MPITRRQMLASAAVGSAVSIGCGQSVAVANQQSPALQPLSQRVKYCLNTSTVRGQKLGIVEQVELCSRAGYQAIEPWIGDLRRYIEEGGQLAELGKRIVDAGLSVESAIGFARWIVDDSQARQDGLAEARRDMEMLAAIGGKRIAAPPIGAHTEAGPDLPVIAERYRALLELGDQTGVVPQLELWGFSRTLSRLGELAYVAAEAGHPSACVLPDVYHIYKGGSSFAGLSMLAANKIHVFHMNDYPSQPARAEIKDSDRVYPGDGVAPLDAILGDLDRNGFAGVLSLELFNETYWAQPADLVATTGIEKMRAAVARADSKAITAAP
ncbi:sugar phosphate isomerase/epimerase family protein [Planctomycetaceae bacterium SH139]